MMDIVDVTINSESLLYDYHCVINAVTISPLVKKQYLVDLAAADGSKDLSEWFGAPRFESRMLTIYAQCINEPATACADRLANLLVGDHVNVRLSFDDAYYRTGMLIQVKPTGPEKSDELQIKILCDPYRYRFYETVQKIPALKSEATCCWMNMGKQTVIPTITVEGDSATIVCGTARYSLSAGEYLLPELAIPGNSEISVTVTGGPLQARYREAVI